MGSRGSFSGVNGSGTLSKRKWKQVGTVGGMKVLAREDGGSVNLPHYANTPNSIYASFRHDGTPKQIAFHEGGRAITKQIDLDHNHGAGRIHVHEFHNGIRDDTGRAPTEEERRYIRQIEEYGGDKQ